MPTFRLTKYVKIRKADKPTSDFGYSGESPVQVCTAWAEIQPLSATERVSAEQLTPGSTHRIVIRWPGQPIDSGMVVECDAGEYEILGALDLRGDGEYLELTCTKHRDSVGKGTTR